MGHWTQCWVFASLSCASLFCVPFPSLHPKQFHEKNFAASFLPYEKDVGQNISDKCFSVIRFPCFLLLLVSSIVMYILFHLCLFVILDLLFLCDGIFVFLGTRLNISWYSWISMCLIPSTPSFSDQYVSQCSLSVILSLSLPLCSLTSLVSHPRHFDSVCASSPTCTSWSWPVPGAKLCVP